MQPATHGDRPTASLCSEGRSRDSDDGSTELEYVSGPFSGGIISNGRFLFQLALGDQTDYPQVVAHGFRQYLECKE